jgi:hypothetical protein
MKSTTEYDASYVLLYYPPYTHTLIVPLRKMHANPSLFMGILIKQARVSTRRATYQVRALYPCDRASTRTCTRRDVEPRDKTNVSHFTQHCHHHSSCRNTE